MKDCNSCKHHVQGEHPSKVITSPPNERVRTCGDCLESGTWNPLPYYAPKVDLDFTKSYIVVKDALGESVMERLAAAGPGEVVEVPKGFDFNALDVVPETPPKDTNPKDRIGAGKAPLDLVPDTIKALASLAFLEGALKYGACNWRVAGVRASIYKAALERHLAKWWNGEWADPVTKVPHLASVIACAGIIADADLAGKLTDDRPPSVDMGKFFEEMEENVKHLQILFQDCNPKHHTIKDSI